MMYPTIALVSCVLLLADVTSLEQKNNKNYNLTAAHTKVKRAATADSSKLWPNATVVYKFDSQLSVDLRVSVLKAIIHWQNKTCIRFREKNKYDKDFVFFTSTSCGCCSLVGRVGGKQDLSLKDYCAKPGVVIHELGHAIGFWHEHTRPDRDSFIKVLWDNVQPDKHDNFKKRQFIEIQSFGRPYDFSSIMHYGPGTFSNGKGPTMVVKGGGKVGKQATSLSTEDILQTNLLYNCPAQDCNVELKGTVSGAILSPYYPNNYTPDLDCQWTIQVPQGKYIELKFNDLKLQDSYKCSADQLTIRENSETGRLICMLCGTVLPPGIVSTTSLWLKLHSNWLLEKQGFNISYEIRDILPVDVLRLDRHTEDSAWRSSDCTQVSRDLHGTYNSAAMPNNGKFTTNAFCSFIIDGSPATAVNRLKLELSTSQMRAYGEDCYGYVFVPVSSANSSYVGTFESSADDENILDPALWRRVHYTCMGTDHVVELILEQTMAVVIWSSEEHRSLNLQYWIDIDECLLDHPCDHICVDTLEGYNCSCNDGYQLVDTFSCVRKKPAMASRCHQQLTAPVGKIISSTEPYSLCSYDILRPGHKISLVFRRLHFAYPGQCSLNSINVTSNKNVIAQLCNGTTGLELTAGESISIVQHVNVSAGALPFFIAQYSTFVKRADECEFSKHGAAEIVSPGYPNRYQPNMDCVWKLSVNKRSSIALTFTDIDIEYTDECAFDSLRVYDGRNKKAPLLLTVCDVEGNRTVFSTDNRLTVRFTSDNSGAGRGFRMILKESTNDQL